MSCLVVALDRLRSSQRSFFADFLFLLDNAITSILILLRSTSSIKTQTTEIMSNHHDDEPLFPLEMPDHRHATRDANGLAIDPTAANAIDNDDDNRFIDNDTGVDPSQNEYD